MRCVRARVCLCKMKESRCNGDCISNSEVSCDLFYLYQSKARRVVEVHILVHMYIHISNKYIVSYILFIHTYVLFYLLFKTKANVLFICFLDIH